jgi:ribulose-5-phosphate 4-epimerase/fuculose-1-phosphate aldolase
MSKPANAAGFLIHSAIHRARPDVVAACHTHSPHGMAWSAFGRPLEMLTQDAAYLYGDAQAVYPVWSSSISRGCWLTAARTLEVWC